MSHAMTIARSRAGSALATGLQIGALIGLWWVCDTAVRAFRAPVPGGVLGLAALAAFLLSGLLPVRWVARGAGTLLDHLLLFFVPAAMTLLNHPELFGWIGFKVLAVIVTGVFLVMVGTGLAVEWHLKLRSRHVRRAR